MSGCGATVVARRATAAPTPGVACPGEADFGHQSRDRVVGQTDGCREIKIDGVVAAGGAHLSRMAGEAVGEIDADPLAAEPAISQSRAARVRCCVERCSAWTWQRRHRLAGSHCEQSRAPELCAGL